MPIDEHNMDLPKVGRMQSSDWTTVLDPSSVEVENAIEEINKCTFPDNIQIPARAHESSIVFSGLIWYHFSIIHI
jgi:hypothetical protein